jgi:hypothetical protein
MSKGYVVLWSRDYCTKLRRAGDVGRPLQVVYGGEHSSQPLISKYGVSAGDVLYPIAVRDGKMFIVGGMRVTEIIPWVRYVTHHLWCRRDPRGWHAHLETQRTTC